MKKNNRRVIFVYHITNSVIWRGFIQQFGAFPFNIYSVLCSSSKKSFHNVMRLTTPAPGAVIWNVINVSKKRSVMLIHAAGPSA